MQSGKGTPSSTEMCSHQRPKLPKKYQLRGLEKIFCLIAITSASPKVGVTASKLVPTKERWGPRGFKIISNRLSVPRC